MDKKLSSRNSPFKGALSNVFEEEEQNRDIIVPHKSYDVLQVMKGRI